MGGAAHRMQPTFLPRSHVDYVQFVARDPWPGAGSSSVSATAHASARRPDGEDLMMTAMTLGIRPTAHDKLASQPYRTLNSFRL